LRRLHRRFAREMRHGESQKLLARLLLFDGVIDSPSSLSLVVALALAASEHHSWEALTACVGIDRVVLVVLLPFYVANVAYVLFAEAEEPLLMILVLLGHFVDHHVLLYPLVRDG
jgi:hypothetical protein